jgi:hypothetical protein
VLGTARDARGAWASPVVRAQNEEPGNWRCARSERPALTQTNVRIAPRSHKARRRFPRPRSAPSASLRRRTGIMRTSVGLACRLAFAVDPRCASRQRGPSPAARDTTSSRSSRRRIPSRTPASPPASGVRSRT